MKTIVHIITGLQQAGAETLLYRLVTSDLENRHIIISLTSRGYYGVLLSKAGFEVHEMNFCLKNIVTSSYKLLRLLSKYRNATVHCWMYHSNFIGGIAAKFVGIRNVIWSIHHLDSKYLEGSAKIFSNLSAILSSSLPDRIVYVSEESRNFHLQDGYSFGNATVVYNFVDTSIYYPSVDRRDEFRRVYNISNDECVFASIARWHPIKGHSTLIRSFSLLVKEFPSRSYRLVLVGPGINSDNYELVELIKYAGIENETILLDAQPYLEHVYPGIDVHVLASRKEAFGMATLEANACGVTTISSDVGFARRFISDHSLLFEVDDYESLFESMKYASHKIKFQELTDLELDDFTLTKAKAEYNKVWSNR